MFARACLSGAVIGAFAGCGGEEAAAVAARASAPAAVSSPPPGEPPAPWSAAPVPVSGPPLPWAASPRYDEVAVLGTHNAYWVDRGAPGDLFASGVGERLLDQLAFERVRSIELDIHRDEARPGEFRVYHTRPGNSLCDSLRDCLGEVRAFAWALPRHDPLLVIVELKQLRGSNFDDAHRHEDLDRLLREELGPALFAPDDLLARCPGETTLAACVERARWPGLAELRGRVLVALLGNWDELGAQATVDWSGYAGGPIGERAAFPMASSWKLDVPPGLEQAVTRAELERARAQSVLLQVETLRDPNLTPWLAAGAVVRANGAEGVAAQERRLSLGVQVLQTDTPWLRARGAGAGVASISLAAEATTLVEPGRRLSLAAEAGEEVFAQAAGEGAFELAALVTAGRSAAVGCLRAEGDGDESITVCRGKLTAAPGPDAERAYVEVETCSAGACEEIRVLSREPDAGGVGDVLALVGEADGCVTARSARTAGRTLAPEFVEVRGADGRRPAPERLVDASAP